MMNQLEALEYSVGAMEAVQRYLTDRIERMPAGNEEERGLLGKIRIAIHHAKQSVLPAR